MQETKLSLYNCTSQHIFTVRGEESTRYLQGRLTQDIKALAVNSGANSLLLSPQGKILGKFIIARLKDSYLIITDPLALPKGREEFLENLLKFRVADRVLVEPDVNLSALISLQGANTVKTLESLGVEKLPAHELQSESVNLIGLTVLIIRHSRGTSVGFDLILPAENVKEIEKFLFSSSLIRQGTFAELECLRIEKGEPSYENDLINAIAPEINLETFVSFSKGCYAGQEVVEMVSARGRPNRKLFKFYSSGIQPLNIGADIMTTPADGTQLTRCGTITSSCFSPDRNIIISLGFIKSTYEFAAEFFADGNKLEVRAT